VDAREAGGGAIRADLTEAIWDMQAFSRRWLAWSAGFDVLLTPTVGVPPLPIGAYKLPTLQRQAIKLLAALPAGALLSQRPRITEAFAQVFDASPYTMVANVTASVDVAAAALDADGLPMGMLFTARIGDERRCSGWRRSSSRRCPGGIAGRRTRRPDQLAIRN